MLKRTPLYETHRRLGARLVEFGGWEMPVQYSGIVEEHRAVRTAAGLFDISHMGEVRFSGPQAENFLNYLLTNDIRKLQPGQGQYSLLCNPEGGTIDDLYIYRLEDQLYLAIINASRAETDVAWMQEQFRRFSHGAETALEVVSDQTGALALQGPKAADVLADCFPGRCQGGTEIQSPMELKKNRLTHWHWTDAGEAIWISRTGYTGEDGFEIVAASELLLRIWERILEVGQPHGLKPCGLGARDTLRTEACLPLYGHELDEKTSPLEAGLGFAVALDKEEFIGRSVLAGQKAEGTRKKLAAFKMIEKSAPPRPHYPLWSAGPDGLRIGEVTSGTQSPTLGVGIGLGYVPPEQAQVGTRLAVEIRGRYAAAEIVPKPFHRQKTG